MDTNIPLDNMDDLDDLMNELKNTKNLTNIMKPAPVAPTAPETITEDNIADFIFRKSALVIEQGIDAIETIKSTVQSGADAETIDAYSKLLASVTKSIDVLNKVNLQKRKERSSKELKELELNGKQLASSKSNITNQTNIIVATREEMMQALMSKAEEIEEVEANAEVIEAEIIEVGKD